MNTHEVFRGGFLLLLGLVIGLLLNTGFPKVQEERATTLVPTIKPESAIDPLFTRKYPNPCMPLGNKKIACLPSYIVLGAMKAGTTFIDYYLQKHPLVVNHPKKEIFFFSQQHGNGISWYSSHFLNYTMGDSKIIGESTPVYLAWPLVPERMRITIPSVKLIITLRDPVARTYSQYFHSIRWLAGQGVVMRHTFEELLEEEFQLMKHCGMFPGSIYPTIVPFLDLNVKGRFYDLCWEQCTVCFAHNNSLHGSPNPAFGLILKSMYYDQISNWFKFFPPHQFLILSYEEMILDPEGMMKEVQLFLGLPEHNYKNFETKNGNTYPDINRDTKKALLEFFHPHNLKLYRLLGKDFSWE